MDEMDFTAVEIHRVKNGWMVHPTRGWLDRGDVVNWDERIWVFNNYSDLVAWMKDRLWPMELGHGKEDF